VAGRPSRSIAEIAEKMTDDFVGSGMRSQFGAPWPASQADSRLNRGVLFALKIDKPCATELYLSIRGEIPGCLPLCLKKLLLGQIQGPEKNENE